MHVSFDTPNGMVDILITPTTAEFIRHQANGTCCRAMMSQVVQPNTKLSSRTTRPPIDNQRCNTNSSNDTVTTAYTNRGTLPADCRTCRITPNVCHAKTKILLASYGDRHLQYGRTMQQLRSQSKLLSTQKFTSTVSSVRTSLVCSYK